MRSSWGRQFEYSLFGESHGAGIGITIHHLPAGFKPDFEQIRQALDRRKPGKEANSTKRNETDQYEIISGFFNDHLTGAPLTVFFPNKDTRSGDYAALNRTPRPSHSDYAAQVKYRGFQDYRGGGHFSGRLTAPIVFAGALAAQMLARKGIEVVGHISQLGSVADSSLTTVKSHEVKAVAEGLKASRLPMIDESAKHRAQELLETVRSEGDSLGGQIEIMAYGVPAGLGEPFFNSLESVLAHLYFSIPGVKAVEFGAGTGFASLKGSEANDPWGIENGAVQSLTNHSGGINGGISNGMAIHSRVTFRPTPSIALAQKSIDLSEQKETTLNIVGRHDPCILPRACPVVEAMTAIGLLEALAEHQSHQQEEWI